MLSKLAANKLLYLLLKEILLIAIRICYCVILCYLVYKHSCLLAYYFLIYIRIISKDKEVLLGFNGVKGDITRSNYRMFNNSYDDSNNNSNAKI
ncbi:hypothetical protein HBI88_204530 [Parastagonospora nodorum]|nr:hypothetical protein HBI97_128090 [Parastagonospora nodorum]KAH5906801.1 hypothetical protein HBI88_204530 [Parastagonospora nodorum]